MKSPPTAFVVRRALPSEATVLTALARRSKAHWGYSEEFMRSCENELTYLPHAEGFYRAVGAEQIGTRESASIPDRCLSLFNVSVGNGHAVRPGPGDKGLV
jgi:hypothetical protein